MNHNVVDHTTRFDVLDALRGVCALLVALFHFKVNGHIMELGLVQHGWIFVDYFFVLSGFVIAHSYGERLQKREVSVPRFIALRFGRIYPLHIVVLAAFVAIELVFLIFGEALSSYVSRPPFSEGRSVNSLLKSIFLLNSFGLPGFLGWNFPSWSIAAEMWTYALFALVFLAGRKSLLILSGLLLLACTVIMVSSKPYLGDFVADGGILRCISGFAIGVITYHAFCRFGGLGGHFWELAALIGTFAYVWFATGIATFFAPFLFGGMIFILATQQGVVSRVLSLRAFQQLGLVSYSIYMIHIFVQDRLENVLQLFGTSYDAYAPAANGEFAAASVQADLLTLVMLILVVIGAFISYHLIEKPARDLTRKWLQKSTKAKVGSSA